MKLEEQTFGTPYIFILKKMENSNTRKLRKIFRAPGENQTQDPVSSSLGALTTELLDSSEQDRNLNTSTPDF